MRAAEAVGDYVSLALRLDALLPGAADFPGPRPAVGKATPAAVVADAGRLAAALPDTGLGPERERFLRAQLLAVEWTARRLAGQRVPFDLEVAASYEVRISLGTEDVYRRIHSELAELLPGRGPLAGRMQAHSAHDEVPVARLVPAVHAISAALRERTRAVVSLPDDEHVEYQVVPDAPWIALHQYLGGYRSLVTLNAGARLRRAQLVHLVAHEAYPGHHTERCRREARPVAAGWDEHRVMLAVSPQGTLAEGAAELGLHALVGPRWGRFAATVLDGVLPGFDGEHAERVHAATAGLARVRQDASVMVHGQGVRADDVLAHLRRWALLDDTRAARVLRFLRHPLWRAYPATYVEGGELLRRWWELDPRPARFVRLLDEPLTPAAVRAELTSGGSSGPVPRERPLTATAPH
ncbi:hypothetical protein GCM10009609_62170 [Pseudonocardia aurantiaca]|uniref:DUF885 domain-containing protein n=1 Tax=Pseudonocardia aurantiaca TaxID=75290 RepID=A0ABW4FSJ5_9PSEU